MVHYPIEERGRRRHLDEPRGVGWTGNGREATNDSRDLPDGELGFLDGFPVIYECDPASARNPLFPLRRPVPPVHNITVWYDYEILLQDDEETIATEDVQTKVLPGGEWGLLWNMAKASGIINSEGPSCMLSPLPPTVERLRGRRKRKRRRDLQDIVESEQTFVVGLLSLPRDVVQDNQNCRTLEAGEGQRCVSVAGGLLAKYVGEDERAVEKYVLKTAQEELDSQRTLVAPVQRTAFDAISNRDVSATQAQSGGSVETSMLVATIVTAGAGLLIIAAAVAFTRRRRRRSSRSPGSHASPDPAELSTVVASNQKSAVVLASHHDAKSTQSSTGAVADPASMPVSATDDSSEDASRMVTPPASPPDLHLTASDDSEVSSNSVGDSATAGADNSAAVAGATAAAAAIAAAGVATATSATSSPPRTRSPIVVETVTGSSSSDDSEGADNEVASTPPVVVMNPFSSPRDMPPAAQSFDEAFSPSSASAGSSAYYTPHSFDSNSTDAFVSLESTSTGGVTVGADPMIESLADDIPAVGDATTEHTDATDAANPTTTAAAATTEAETTADSTTLSGSGGPPGAEPSIVDFLPPLPPGHHKTPASPSRPSQPLKKRRRKKKLKKQKNALKRINSRESINEMESIPEEDDSYQDGLGSEYSWSSDEEEDSGRASRDPSPARSTGSKAEF